MTDPIVAKAIEAADRCVKSANALSQALRDYCDGVNCVMAYPGEKPLFMDAQNTRAIAALYAERKEMNEWSAEPDAIQDALDRMDAQVAASKPLTARDCAMLFLIDSDFGDSQSSNAFTEKMRKLAEGESGD